MLLAGNDTWADHEETLAARQRFLDKFIRDGAKPRQRGESACMWFGSLKSSDPFADEKKSVFSTDADGIGPYLDPHVPVSDDHLATVAIAANLSKAQRDEMVWSKRSIPRPLMMFHQTASLIATKRHYSPT